MTPDVAIDIARDCFVIPKAAATLLVSCCDGSTPEIRARARQALRSLDRWAKVWIPEPGVLITRPGLVDPFDVGKVELAIAVCIGRMCRTAD
ncbi:MAG: hypothetical protein JXO72_06605, partial [Vicinamibacteria bacterium]|nr:hypothetical protein [Vicinamibacteria bacterium]